MDKLMLMGIKIPEQTENRLEVCVLPEGKFFEKDWFGEKRKIGYTKEDIAQMVKNFEAGLPHYTPFVNIGHSNDSIAEVKKIYQVSDETEKQNGLWAVVEDENAYELTKKYRYASVEVYDNYLEGEGGEDKGKVFAGFALTNRPRHKLIKKIQFEELVEKMKDIFGFEVEIEDNNKQEEDMTIKEYEEKMEAQRQEFEAKLTEKQKELDEYEAEVFASKVAVWKAEKSKEGYTPANIDKFAEKITNKTVTFEVAEEFIALTEKVLEGQIVGEATFTDKEEELSAEEMGRRDAKLFEEGAE